MPTTEQHFGDFEGNITTVVNTTNETWCDNDVLEWYEITLVIYMVLTTLLAVSGNGIIILVERNNKCKTSTDWLVCFMAANDLIYAIVNIPVHISLQLETWTFSGSDTLCKGHTFVERVTMYSSALLLCIVALDRYWKTCRPHTKFLTPERAFKVCIFETFVCCAVTSPVPVITVYDGTSRCIAIQLDSAITKAVTSVVSVTYVIMFLIVCVCYTKVALTIRRKLIQTHDVVERREKGNGNNQPGTKQPIENIDSSKTSSIKWLRGRNCKIHPFADSDCGTKESKIIPTPVKGSKERVFENVVRYPRVTNESRLDDLDEKNKTSSTTVQGNVKRLMLVDSRVNRTTKIMFAVTLVFLGSWIPTWIVIFYKQLNEADKSLGGKIFATFGEKSFMLNTFTNPIFYICLSTVFKQRAKQLVKNLFICRKRDQRSHTG